MGKKEKIAFIVYDSEKAEIFNEALKRKMNIETTLNDCLSRKIIYVPSEKYLESIEVGTEIAKEKDIRSIKWVNFYEESRPLGYVSVMYCKLPKTRIGSHIWSDLELEHKNCPIDIINYINHLRKSYLNGRDVQIEYNGADNAIEVLVEASLEEFDHYINQCKFHDYFYQKNPFIKTTFLKPSGELTEVKKDEQVIDGLRTYLYKSLFMDGLRYPCGSNIAPKSDNDMDLESGYKYNTSSYCLRNFDITSVEGDEVSKIFKGYFLSEVGKNYSYYWDSKKSQEIRGLKNMPFTMLDNGFFESNVTYVDPTLIELNTTIDVVRNVVGYNFDGKTVRDGFFGNNKHEDCRFNVNIKEYFKKIGKDGKRLLHYSDYSDSFEIYELLDYFDLSEGISKDKLGYSKVFEDTIHEINDEDIEEIRNLMDATKKKDSVKSLNKN